MRPLVTSTGRAYVELGAFRVSAAGKLLDALPLGVPSPAGPDDAQDWALRHTGRTGHDLFRRAYTDHARVTLAK